MAGRPTLATGAREMIIPNRHVVALDPAERLAEGGDRRRLREAAKATGNWSLVNILAALAEEARQKRRAGKIINGQKASNFQDGKPDGKRNIGMQKSPFGKGFRALETIEWE
jgi:hypothetical protein